MTNETATLLDDEIPAKFKDPETGQVRVENLVRSYKELEKKMSTQPAAPKDHSAYKIECPHGLFEPDEDINKRLHAKGLSNDQAQEVYDLAAEKMMPLIQEIIRDVQADREVEKLINHFGGPDNWKEVSRQLLTFGQKHLPADVLDNLSSSYEGVLALYKMMKSEEPGLKNEAATQEKSDAKDLEKMMRDPKYWREKDPAFVKKVTDGFKELYG